MAHEVESKVVSVRHLAVKRFHATMGEFPEKMPDAFSSVERYLAEIGRGPEGPAFGFYEPLGPGEFNVAAGFEVQTPVEGRGDVEPFTLPGGEVAYTEHLGDYSGLPAAHQAVQDWMAAEGREPAGVMWEEYHSPPDTPPEQTRTGIYWPLKPR